MSVQAVLAPVFVQVALVFALLFWMGRVRFAEVGAGRVKIGDIEIGRASWRERV